MPREFIELRGYRDAIRRRPDLQRRRQPHHGDARLADFARRPGHPAEAASARDRLGRQARSTRQSRTPTSVTRDPAAVADAEQNLMLRKGWEALGAFDPDERAARARPARLQIAVGLHDVRDHAFLGRVRPGSLDARGAVRRHARAQSRDRGFLPRRQAPARGRFRPARHPGACRKRNRRGDQARMRRDPYPVAAAGEEVADAS